MAAGGLQRGASLQASETAKDHLGCKGGGHWGTAARQGEGKLYITRQRAMLPPSPLGRVLAMHKSGCAVGHPSAGGGWPLRLKAVGRWVLVFYIIAQ